MKTSLNAILAAVLLISFAAMMVWPFIQARGDEDEQEQQQPKIASAARVFRNTEGQTVLAMSQQTLVRSGIRAEPLATTSAQCVVVAYGTLQEDPSQSFTLRAPMTGTLSAAGDCHWPTLGEQLSDGTCVGTIEPLFAPAEQIDLASRLATAQADVQANTAALAADRAAYERAKSLYTKAEAESQQDVQQRQAKMLGDEARLAAARQTVKVLEAALAGKTPPSANARLAIKGGGRVVQIAANPGEAVQSGQTLLRVARFSTMLAIVALPASEQITAPIKTARLVVVGHEDHPLEGIVVAPTAAVEPKTLGQTFIFRVNADGLTLQSGAMVTAHLVVSSPQKAALIPRSAVVWAEGKPWAYASIAADQFTRQLVPTTQPVDHGWAAGLPFAPGRRVVVSGAQQLLSEESRVLPRGD